jgi:hypothetical protein
MAEMIFGETSSTGGSTLIPGDTPRSPHTTANHDRTGMTRLADDLPDLHSFTCGLTHDHDAVLAGLTLEHSSGAAGGNVNRIKMIKRQMYGRAGFALLRKRVLLAT